MGGIFAKLDNQDKIISLERKLEKDMKYESSLDLNRLKDFINKYGYIRIELDTNQFNTYLKLLGAKYFKKNPEITNVIYGDMGVAFVRSSIMLSTFNLVVLQEKEKKVEGFNNVVGHEMDTYSVFENFGNLETEPSPKDQQGFISPGATMANNAKILEKEGNFYVLLPKIYFTDERNAFIDFLIAGLPIGDNRSNEGKQIYLLVKNILKKINETPNPEVKIANTIGLFVRLAISMAIQNLFNRQNGYSSAEKVEMLSEMISDHLEDIPYDECVFYNDKLNFIKFAPNVCQKAKEEKALNLKKIYGTASLVQEQKACPVQEQKACPVQEQVACPQCGEQKCPEHVCPACVKPSCPEPEEPSNTWKYASILLTIIVIVMVVMMIFKSSGTKPNVKNLTKLN